MGGANSLSTVNPKNRSRNESFAMCLAVIYLAVGPATYAQTPKAPPLKSGWLRVMLPGVCTLDIAPTMSANSVLSDPVRMTEMLKKAPKSQLNDWTTKGMQREQGLNLLKVTQSGLKNYMRIMVDATPIPEAKAMLATKDPGLTDADAKDIQDGIMANEFGTGETKVGNKLLGSMRSDRIRFNGYYAIRGAYTRQFGTNPPVKVENYLLFDRGRMIKIVASYRVVETAMWAGDVAHALSSIRLVE